MSNTNFLKVKHRIDGYEKVTGSLNYVDDINIDNTLCGAVVRSKSHFAEIVSIDTSQALKMPGVVDIITSEDIPGDKIYGPIIKDRPVLAASQVRFMGEPIAVVIAKGRREAYEAANCVEVKYLKKNPIFDPVMSINSISENLHNNTNLACAVKIEDGDIEKGFSEADFVIEKVFNVPFIYHAYLETESALAEYKDDTIKIYFSTQEPFFDRDTVASILGFPKESIEIIVPAVGGGFGGKQDPNLAILAALSALKTKGTVKLTNTRRESILAHHKRHAAEMHYKIGIKKDGKITALHAKSYMNNGAYCGLGPAVAQLHTETASGAYKISNICSETNLVYTNSPSGGAMRGFGAPQSNFAIEGIISAAAEIIGVNINTIREKNIIRDGDFYFNRVKINQPQSVKKCLDEALNYYNLYETKYIGNDKSRYGIGVALAVQTLGMGNGVPDSCNVKIKLCRDGFIEVDTGSTELGQGLNSIAAQIVSSVLTIDYSTIKIAKFSTSSSPDGGNTCASRRTYMTGNALIKASNTMIDNLIKTASHLYNIPHKNLTYKNGIVVSSYSKTVEYPLSKISFDAFNRGIEISSSAKHDYPYVDMPAHLPVGLPHAHFSFGATVAVVELNKDFNKIAIKEIVSINDVGKIINQKACEGQVEGSVVMGLGYALSEEFKLKPDGNWNNSLTDYILPTSLDSPDMINCVFLEEEEPSGPFGAKGIGETPVVSVASAITDAVKSLTGRQVFKLPIKL